MPVTSYPPDQMYASPADDPALACQCGACRNARAVLPAPLDYDADGYDQFGNDEDGDDRHGNSHQERHGRPGYRGTDASDLDLGDLWREFTRRARQHDTTAFRTYLRDILTDPDAADEVQFCAGCGDPAWSDDTYRTGNGLDFCDSCYSELSSCVSCDERYPDDYLNTTLGDNSVCDHCRDNYYTYCEDCDGYYHDEDAGDHDHDSSDGDGCCDSPQTAFTVRNDGEDPLANDTRVTIELPAGTISPEGLEAITRYVRDQSYIQEIDAYRHLSRDLDTIGDKWQAKDGNYAKRLSRHAYKTHQLKLTPEDLSRVGTIARDHSTAVSTTIEVSRELNESAGYWYHEDSCWWGSYSEGRCTLKTNGGFGLRSFSGDSNYAGVSGRAWVLPLRLISPPDGIRDANRLVPTFDTRTPDAFVVFNGYGDLSGYAAPRILAHMAGWTYRKIGFRAEPMYVNAGGYLVAPEDIAKDYTDGDLTLHVDQHSSLYQDERERDRELVHA